MKSFSSRPTSGRRLYAPGLTLPADAGPAAAHGASRRPRHTSGQALLPPPGLTLPAGAGPARPLADTPRASLGVSSRSPARPCRPRADLMWQTIVPPTEQSGRASHLEARPGPAAVPGASRRPRLGMTLSALLVSALLFIVGAPSSVADPSPYPDLAQSVAAHEEW